MKIIALFKKIVVFTLFFIPIWVFAQNDSIVNVKLPVNAEKLEVNFQYSAITFLNTNTTKVTVSNYGDGKIKKKSGSASTTKVLGITYDESKFKFFIYFRPFHDDLFCSPRLRPDLFCNTVFDAVLPFARGFDHSTHCPPNKTI